MRIKNVKNVWSVVKKQKRKDWVMTDEELLAMWNSIHNQAIDKHINKLLAASGVDVPAGYKGMTSEQVYNELIKENDNG